MTHIELIGSILVSAIKNLFNNQPDVLNYTSETHMTEWNLGHHLANEIKNYIFWLNHDLDVIKFNHDRKRPDTIFHKRGSNNFNYLVIEIKKSSSNLSGIQNDIEKIKENWMHPPLNYQFGASVVIVSATDFNVRLFDRESGADIEFSDTTKYLDPPALNKTIRNEFRKAIDNGLSDTNGSEYEHQIDQLVYKLYGLTEDKIKVVGDKL